MANGNGLGFAGEVTLAVSVKDIDASIGWYEKVLGFKLKYKVDEIGWCELNTHIPGVTVGLSQVENPEPSRSTVPTWGVNDVEKTRAALESQQVRFDGPTRAIGGMVKLASFYDPDGNAWELAQGTAPA